jgi:hypothetical protein
MTAARGQDHKFENMWDAYRKLNEDEGKLWEVREYVGSLSQKLTVKSVQKAEGR